MNKLIIFLIFFLLYSPASLAMQELDMKIPQWAEADDIPTLKGEISKNNPYTGIGVVGLKFIHETGYPSIVEEVYPNSPASRAGIIKKDLIFAINGIKTSSLISDDVYKLFSGNPGSSVEISIKRRGETFVIDLVREDLANLSSDVQYRYLAGPVSVPFNIKDLSNY